jgi:hypothetical protein
MKSFQRGLCRHKNGGHGLEIEAAKIGIYFR